MAVLLALVAVLRFLIAIIWAEVVVIPTIIVIIAALLRGLLVGLLRGLPRRLPRRLLVPVNSKFTDYK